LKRYDIFGKPGSKVLEDSIRVSRRQGSDTLLWWQDERQILDLDKDGELDE
jgi:hypothetical protein